jgi:hypothetical protein
VGAYSSHSTTYKIINSSHLEYRKLEIVRTISNLLKSSRRQHTCPNSISFFPEKQEIDELLAM